MFLKCKPSFHLSAMERPFNASCHPQVESQTSLDHSLNSPFVSWVPPFLPTLLPQQASRPPVPFLALYIWVCTLQRCSVYLPWPASNGKFSMNRSLWIFFFFLLLHPPPVLVAMGISSCLLLAPMETVSDTKPPFPGPLGALGPPRNQGSSSFAPWGSGPPGYWQSYQKLVFRAFTSKQVVQIL